MDRKWKPGNVAALSIGGEEAVGIVRDHRDDGVPVWVISGHSFYKSIAVGNDSLIQGSRPLVVIDPEDREAVERLEADFAERCGWSNLSSGERSDGLQAALREFAAPKPPKPEEPTGLGAVVEDAEGEQWVRSHREPRPWTRPHLSGTYSFAAIAAVRVLSEGVTA